MIALQAHRGASHAAPENTLAAFSLALAEGADAIELDVRMSADGVPVVFHDDDLARMTGAAGRVATSRLEELQALRVGAGAEGRAGEPIPLLADMVAFSERHRLPLNVEIKPSARPERVVAACLPHLAGIAAAAQLMVSSFDPRALALVHRALPEVGLALIFDDLRALAALPLLPAVDLHPKSALVTPERLAEWQRAPRAVRAWTVDERNEARRLLAYQPGLAALITNRPGPLRAELMDAA